MRYLVTVVLAVCLACAPARAHALDPEQPIPTWVDGREGIWFPMSSARMVLETERERITLAARVRLLDRALSLAGQETEALRSALETSESSGEALRRSLARAQADAAQAREWYRDPFLWGGLGFAVGVVLVTAIALAVGGQ
jgi:hypothetical protein